MKVPQLKKKLEIKSCHNIEWEDNYSWIHQENILEVLDQYISNLQEFKRLIEQKNYEAIYDKMLKTNAIKEILTGIN